MNEILILVLIIIGVIIGVSLTIFINAIRYKNKSIKILKDAKRAGEQFKKDKILQAKEKFIELKAAHEQVIQKKNNDLRKQRAQV